MFLCQDKGENREKVNDLSYRDQIFTFLCIFINEFLNINKIERVYKIPYTIASLVFCH